MFAFLLCALIMMNENKIDMVILDCDKSVRVFTLLMDQISLVHAYLITLLVFLSVAG